MTESRANWVAAVLLGLLSSTYSTLLSQLVAARIGRDAEVDWMTVAAIPWGDNILQAHPSLSAIVLGIAFHQWADFSWAIFFFAILGRWTSKLSPLAVAAIALPWAVFTSSLEWTLLVPVAPFAQPIFTLQQPYWIGFLVHLSSAAVYPLFFPIKAKVMAVPNFRKSAFVSAWSMGLVTVVIICGLLAFIGVTGHELTWWGRDKDTDEKFIRHMVTHHEQGIELANLASTRAKNPHLRALGRLMAASQSAENEIFQQWWVSWFNGPMPVCSAIERFLMPGLLTEIQVARLQRLEGTAFDDQFVADMTYHHAGAVKMSDDQLRSSGDIRLKLMAHAIRHEQQGEIALMNGVKGLSAVMNAIQNMFADNINQCHGSC